jgi:hypothetical protein
LGGAMNRHEKIKKIANLTDKVSHVSNIEVNSTRIDPSYVVQRCTGSLSETGNLEIFRVVSNSKSDPLFVARWDQKPEELDIDIRCVSITVARDFKNKRNGYAGHHTNRSTDPSKRLFEVKIAIPHRLIFEGRVSFSNSYYKKQGHKFVLGDFLDAQIIKGSGK